MIPAVRGFLFLMPWDLQQPGGVTQVVINLFNQVCIDGAYQPMVLISRWEQSEAVEVEVEGRPTIFYRLRSPWDVSQPVRNLLMFVATLPLSFITLLNLLRKYRIEVINAHYPSLDVMILVLLRRLGLFKGKVILSFHGLDIAAASQTSGIERFLWGALLRLCDAIATCSEDLKRQVVSFAPHCGQKVHAVHNGLDIQTLLAERKPEIRLPSGLAGRRYILNVATFEYKKGQDVLIRAFEKVAPQFPDILLVMIGKFCDMKEPVSRQVQQAGLADRVLFFDLMPHAEVVPFLEHAMLFVLSSRNEPFGIVLLEAGCFGVPVIASEVGGIPEIISHDNSGRLFQSGDWEGLARELAGLLAQPQELRRLGDNLRKRVMTDFTWHRAYAKYRRIIGND